jgi:hypothetical protein
MKTPEILNEKMENKNSIQDLADNRVCQCDEDCQKRGKRNLVLLGLVFIMLFLAGYFINPGILRDVWLIASGTLAVINGLLLFMIQVRIVSLKC